MVLYDAPVDLNHEEIRGFIEAWKEDFGETLTPEQAGSEILRLLDFFSKLDDVSHRHLPESSEEEQL